jgi:hypothetical protein
VKIYGFAERVEENKEKEEIPHPKKERKLMYIYQCAADVDFWAVQQLVTIPGSLHSIRMQA